jgi:hypothetical protein
MRHRRLQPFSLLSTRNFQLAQIEVDDMVEDELIPPPCFEYTIPLDIETTNMSDYVRVQT